MTDYALEQEMEIEALEAILMDDFKEIHSSESGLDTSNKCYQITVSPQGEEVDEATTMPEQYPDEPPLLNVKSIRGIPIEDLRILKEKLLQEAAENLGMSMVYTLATSAKEWLSERFGENDSAEDLEKETTKDEVIVPHGEPVTMNTFIAWQERFEAELALKRAKLMPESALMATKEKRLTGRQWFESGRPSVKGAAPAAEDSDEEEEDIDFDVDDFEDDDEEDMLEHYLTEKSYSSAHSTEEQTKSCHFISSGRSRTKWVKMGACKYV